MNDRQKNNRQESDEQKKEQSSAARDQVIRVALEHWAVQIPEMIGQPLTLLTPEYMRHLHRARFQRCKKRTNTTSIGREPSLSAFGRTGRNSRWRSHSAKF
jgi:hypothetical protein